VHTGGGALQDLEQLTTGERIVVRTDRGRIAYEVASVRVFSKGRLAQEAERVFSQEVPGRLVLVTCEDWDGSQYLSNVVVVATTASP
jgi:sortase (surface protein transpeptidase)